MLKKGNKGADVERGLEKLLAICARPGRILILMQDHPDPDALACAKALRKIVTVRLGKRPIIAYGGSCGRAENRVMMKVLRIGARRISPDQLDHYTTLCLVDTQPRSGNNILFPSRIPEIVIDHHNLPRKPDWTAEFCDVRPDYGACSTLLYEYLRASGVKANPNLYTALFYGIQSDTQDLSREASPADIRAYQELFMLADKRKLAEIRRAPVSASYFQSLKDSLSNCVVAGKTVISHIPACRSAETVAEVAELLLRLEGIRSTVCYGLCGDLIHLSARALDARGHVDVRMKKVVNRIGKGGGHNAMAGGQVPAGINPTAQLALVRERILEVFAPHSEPCPLTRPERPENNSNSKTRKKKE